VKLFLNARVIIFENLFYKIKWFDQTK